VARIDLIDVSKTLSERDGRGPRVPPGGGAPDSIPARNARRTSGFSIQHLTLRIPDGQTLVILGPSGCGKTTLLRIIAGLIPPDSGEVRYDDVDMQDVHPGHRRIGMVFQNYALYPHLSSRRNILSYFMFRKKTAELDAMAAARYQRTAELMGVELAHLLDRKPPTLSGGEKQRVALGRCITRDPALFLLDEPFSNLDQGLREKYRVNLKILLKQFGITAVYVTHDHQEALILGDRLAIMDEGRIEQVGTYEEIYERPRNVFVAGFLNRHIGTPPINLIDARHMPEGERLGNAWLGVRPEDLIVSREESVNVLSGVISGQIYLPLINVSVLRIQVGEHEMHVQAPGDARLSVGHRVWLQPRRYHVFDRESGTWLATHPETSRGFTP
jgi:multiple sugar transport system ATP-binding protein